MWAGFLTWVCGVLLFACSLWCGFPQGSVLPAITAVPMVITDTLSQNKHVGMFIYGGPHSESTAGLPLSAFLQTRDLLVLSLSLSESLLAFRNVSVWVFFMWHIVEICIRPNSISITYTSTTLVFKACALWLLHWFYLETVTVHLPTMYQLNWIKPDPSMLLKSSLYWPTHSSTLPK